MLTVSRMTLLDVGGLPNDTLFYIDGLPNDTLFYVDGFPTLFGAVGTGSGP